MMTISPRQRIEAARQRIEAAKARYQRLTDQEKQDLWDEEEQKKIHPRADDGTWTRRDGGQSAGVERKKNSKIPVSIEKMGARWYAMANLPGGRDVTRSHETREEAMKLAHEDIRRAGLEPEEEEKPVKVVCEKMNSRWYSMADLPDGRTIDHSAETRDKAISLAHESIRRAGFKPHEEEKPSTPLEDLDEVVKEEFKDVKKSEPEQKPLIVDFERNAEPESENEDPPLEGPNGEDLISMANKQSAEKMIPLLQPLLKKGHTIEYNEHRNLFNLKGIGKDFRDPMDAVKSSWKLEKQGDSGYWRESEEVPDDVKKSLKNVKDSFVFVTRKDVLKTLKENPIENLQSVDDSPHDGDVDENGLIFRDGRWHRDQDGQTPQERIQAAKKNIESGYNWRAASGKLDDSLKGDENEQPEIQSLDSYGDKNEGGSESTMDGTLSEKLAERKSETGSGIGDAGGLGSLSESSSLGSESGLSELSGVRDGRSDGNGIDSGRSSDSGTAGTGPVGGEGGGIGHPSGGGKAIAESLNETPSVENPTDTSAGNWRYLTRDFYQGGVKAKFRANLEAIKTMRLIAEEGRDNATPAEQEILSRFIGWGSMPGLFNEHWDKKTAEAFGDENAGYQSDTYRNWISEKDKWKDEREEIKALMSDDEWAAARKATLNSHFTHPSVIDAHWRMAKRMGFKGGRFLEPSAGIGYYMGLMPADLAGKTRISAVELDKTTGDMLSMLYPQAHVEVKGFEKQKAPNDFYDLVASNVPFGDYTVNDHEYNKHNANIHDYFFLKSANLTKPGGMVMHVTSTGTMDKQDDSIRRELAKTCDFVSAIRFPGGAHQENAGTQVVTDLIMLRKRYPGEEPVTLDYTPPEAMPPWEKDGGQAHISNEEHNRRLQMERDGKKLPSIPDKPGFTGMTTDSLGRVYHWVDGKRVPGPDWLGVKDVPDPAGGEPIPVNAYFADHPEQILGTLDRSGSLYGGDQKNVTLTDDYEDLLEAAINRVPEGVFTSKANDKKGEPERREVSEGVKDGGYVIRDGKLFKRIGGAEVEQKVDAKKMNRIAGQLAIRDAMFSVIRRELNGDTADNERLELNQVYDQYVKKNGPLSNRENRAAMKGDPDQDPLLALEQYSSETKMAKKADIFSKQTIRAQKRSDKAETVNEGVGICLNETGSIDVDRIAELTGKDPLEVEGELKHGGLAFEDPATGWFPASLYLSGNVRQKLVLAKSAAAVDQRYQHNVDALMEHQPEDIDYQNIDVKLGAGWAPQADMNEFARSLTGDDRIEIQYIPEIGQWLVNDDSKRNQTAAMDQYSTDAHPLADMLSRIMNSKSLVVMENVIGPDGDKEQIDEGATKEAEEKASILKDKFSEWIWEDDERRDRLSRFYNDTFNNIVPVKYDGGHLTFPGMKSNFEMRDIQKDFVWQVITTGRGLAAHEVGTGKTASMVAAAMELRRLGLAKKPCISCMKANIDQLTKEAQDLYPGAKILSTSENFDEHQRKQTISRMATGDYDLVIMTHDNMDMLGMKPEVVKDFIQKQINELEVAKSTAWKADPNKTNRIVKSLEKAKQKLEARLEAAIKESEKDDAVHFEETGIDQIFVDEAHAYKNLAVYSTGERVKGIPAPSTASDRATNMLMRANWLMSRNGNRGVVFATGTPVSNTMVEMYNLQRYLQPDELKSRGINTFDSWASTFGDRQTEIEATPTGGYDQVTRFNKFTNIPELMNMASLVMDVQRADNLKKPDGSPVIIRPTRHDKVVVTPLNEMTEKMMADLQQRARDCKGKRPEKGADNMAVICSDGRKGSVDMRMLYKDAPDDPQSKLNQCVNNVLKLHNERPGVTQLIFSNVGVNPSTDTGFHIYGDIIDKLVKGGIPREKIADFSKLNGAKREDAQAAMRRGEILVAIGSTERLGTGVNVQNRVASLHHLDVPWKPSEIEQRDGRGWRHGNLNDPTQTKPNPKFDSSRAAGPDNPKDVPDPSRQHVDIIKYISQGSLDEFMWQTVASKAFFINQTINAKNHSVRSVSDEDTETLSPEQFMAVASGNPKILEKINLESELKSLNIGREQHKRNQIKLNEKISNHQNKVIPETSAIASAIASDAEHVEKVKDKKTEIRIGNNLHSDRKTASEAIDNKLKEIDASNDYRHWHEMSAPVGEYKGFKIHMPHGGISTNAMNGSSVNSRIVLEGPSGQFYPTMSPSLASMDATIRSIPKHSGAKSQIAIQAVKDLETMKSQIGKTYHRESEYSEKKKQLELLDKELRGVPEQDIFGKKPEAIKDSPKNLNHTKFKSLTSSWLAKNSNQYNLAATLMNSSTYHNDQIAVRVPEKVKDQLLSHISDQAKQSVSSSMDNYKEHAEKVDNWIDGFDSHESPMKIIGDKTTVTEKGWGRNREEVRANHVVMQSHDGTYTALDGEYVSTIQHLYPDATFHPTVKNDSTVMVKSGGKNVGIIQGSKRDQERLKDFASGKDSNQDAEQYSRPRLLLLPLEEIRFPTCSERIRYARMFSGTLAFQFRKASK